MKAGHRHPRCMAAQGIRAHFLLRDFGRMFWLVNRNRCVFWSSTGLHPVRQIRLESSSFETIGPGSNAMYV